MRASGLRWGLLFCWSLVACGWEPLRRPPDEPSVEAPPVESPPVSEGEPVSNTSPSEPAPPPVTQTPPAPEAPSQPPSPPMVSPWDLCARGDWATPSCGTLPCPPEARVPNWCWQPLYARTRLAGYGPGAHDVFVTEVQYPDDPGFVGPSSLQGVYQMDARGAAEPVSLFRDRSFGPKHIFHRRYAITVQFTAPRTHTQRMILVMLDGSHPVRTFELTQALEQQLAQAGVVGTPQPPAWVQGVDGHALLVSQISPEEVWVADLDLASLTLTWGRRAPGFLRGNAIADEKGQLYMPLGVASNEDLRPRHLVALSATGEERWSLPGTGAPKAVLDGTLFVDDGTVRSTEDGSQRYTWPGSGASVLLSDSRAVAVSSAADRFHEARTQVTLMDRRTGAVLAAREMRWGRPELVMLTDSGAVLVLEPVPYPERTYSPFYVQSGLRFLVGRPGGEGGSWEQRGEYFPPMGNGIPEALLVDGQVVLRWQDSGHNNPEPRSRYLVFHEPGLRPPARGWLTPTGGSLGTFAPQ